MQLHHTASRSGKLLSFLRRELGLSSSLVKRLKWQGAFLLDELPVRVDQPVLPGQRITVLLDEAAPEFPPENDPLEILYEDEALLAVDKPAGLLMHPSFYRNTGTLANRVLGYYGRTGQACAVHPVSRLDRDTFGVVLLAKNAHIHGLLMAAPKEKRYEALVWGDPGRDSGVWTAPIARCPGESLLRRVSPDGKAAESRFLVLNRGSGWSHLQLEPVTGRTHQLRVHCAHAGCPILGDPQYGTEASLRLSRELGIGTQRLCAVRLALRHPLSGEPLEITTKQTVWDGATAAAPE